MIKHIWSVLCKESTINQEDNNLSIRDILESLQVGLKPNPENPPTNTEIDAVIPISYEVTSLITRTDADQETNIETEIIVFSPKRLELARQKHNFTIPKGIRRMRIRMKNTGFKVIGSGDYIFQVGMKEDNQKVFKKVAELPLEVLITLESEIKKKTVN